MNMKKLKRIAAFLTLGIVLLMTACNDAPPVIKDASIIPIPMSLKQDTTCFVLPQSTTIGINDPQLRPAAEYLISVLKPATGYSFNINEGEGDINLTVGEVSGVEDSYTLISNPEKVSITGNTYRGVVAGIQSLRQLFPAEIESDKKVNMSWGIPSVEIQDAPRFGWRGLMLDVSRHFYTKEEVMEFLDLMALYKFNKFHWHLTDDQGWRLEIKQYPLLTEKGAWRKFNNHDRDCIRYAAEQDNPDYEIPTDKIQVVEGDTLYGGFYTQDDVKEVIAYAQVRGIDIIPELDMPGHMLAAVSNYNGVSCFEETGWGSTFSSPVCPGKDSALEFCKNVYTELIELFPYEYVHIGGDEVEKTNWKKCPDCQARMKEHGLKTEEELQAWFIHEMEHFFNSKGKKMIGWDEIIEGGLSETATVMWWRSWEKLAPSKTINHGNNLIFSPNAPFYLDYAQDKKSVSNIYNYEPMKEVPDADKQHLVKGVQGNIWCEWIPTRERMHYMAAPRMLAIAELGWSANDRKDWNDFQVRMANQFGRLNVMDVQYRIPDLEGFMKSNVFIGEKKVEITCLDPSATIHYTTDGSIPTLESPKYDGNLVLTETTDLTLRVFRPTGKRSDIVKAHYEKTEYTPAKQVAPSNPGLKATWHDFKGKKCAEIADAPVKKTYRVEDVVIPRGVKSYIIGLIYKGYINIPEDGIYSFYLSSDDGSMLYINGQVIIDNDGLHAPGEVTGQTALKKGYHPIEVQYFDHGGGSINLKVCDNDGKEMPFTYLYAH